MESNGLLVVDYLRGSRGGVEGTAGGELPEGKQGGVEGTAGGGLPEGRQEWSRGDCWWWIT